MFSNVCDSNPNAFACSQQHEHEKFLQITMSCLITTSRWLSLLPSKQVLRPFNLFFAIVITIHVYMPSIITMRRNSSSLGTMTFPTLCAITPIG